jgi:hypothetical protein
MTADEETMMATASLHLEVSKGEGCDLAKVTKHLQGGADLMAVNGEGCTPLLAAVRSGTPAEAVVALLEAGACPDATGREGVTPLQQVMHLQSLGIGDAARLAACAEVLKKHGAVPPDGVNHKERIRQLSESFGLKMVGSLLTLQSPIALPVEVLEVLHMFFKDLPLEVVKQSLEPQAFRALTALMQHLVGSTDSLSTAVIGSRIMRAIYSRPDAALQEVVRSHGALRWSQRLASTKDIAQCGLYRQHNHEKVLPEELCKEARALMAELKVGSVSGDDDCEEWRSNARLVEIVTALDLQSSDAEERVVAAKEALVVFRELLKKTEKGDLTEDRCAAYELEKASMPGHILRFLKHRAPTGIMDPIRQPSMNPDRWAHFREVFGDSTKQARKGLARLVKALHAIIETGEAFPVWRHKKERGLKALTDPVPLKLRHVVCDDGGESMQPFLPPTMRPQILVMVEPLAPVGELSRYLLRVTPTVDDKYLAYCYKLIGATIASKAGDTLVVVAFELLHTGLPLPIHTVRQESSGETQRVLLGVHEFALVGNLPPTISLLDFRVALCKLHAVSGTEAFIPLLDELQRTLRGEPAATNSGAVSATADAVAEAAAKPSEAVQHAMQQAVRSAAGLVEEALTVLAEERVRFALPSGQEGGEGSEMTVDPSMRVHTVMITVSDEIPFELLADGPRRHHGCCARAVPSCRAADGGSRAGRSCSEWNGPHCTAAYPRRGGDLGRPGRPRRADGGDGRRPGPGRLEEGADEDRAE